MAFGFGFNKQKVLSAAEKCVQQGKLQNAISEYEKILKADPKDLTVMNTVGDLHARLGENDKAAECFKNVGDAYASQGFTVKAIAMYKKLSKIKSTTESVLRLAELYTQQGLFNDARAQYLQVAEDFLKTGQLEQAVKIFEKTLEMDPDNVSMRTKLAEVYIRMGKKADAWKILTAAAENLRAKGQLAAADEIVQRMLKLEPGNSYALVLRGRAALDAGDFGAAIATLTKVADLDTNPEGLRTLFQAYLKGKKFAEAAPLATKLATVHDDGAAITEYTDALMEAQQYREALQVYAEQADRFLRNDPAKFAESLRPIVGQVKDDTQALETVLDLYHKAGDTAHATEMYELLAHAYVQAGDLEKAREYYLKLMQAEPANPMHARNYQQVVEKQGASDVPHVITAEEGSVLVEELETTSPFVEQQYDDETSAALRAALTDAELFISYNMPAKALEPLMAALPKAPRDLRLNQKLAALHTRAGKFVEAAVCCRTIESIYRDANHSEDAARYADLAAKYEQRGGSTAPAASAPSVGTQEFEIAAPMPEPADGAEAHVVAAAPPPPVPVAAPPVAVAPPPVPAMAAPAPAKPAPAAPKATATPTGVFFHAPATTAAPAPSEVPEAAPAATAGEFSVSAAEPGTADADLSNEWEEHLEVETHSTAPVVEATPNVPEVHVQAEPAVPEATPVVEAAAQGSGLDEGMEEVRFYLGQGMLDQAEAVLAKLESANPDSSELAVLRLGLDSAKPSTTPAPEPEAEVALEADSAEIEIVEEAPAIEAAEPEPVVNRPQVAAAAQAASSAMPQPWPGQPPAAPEKRPALQEFVSDLEESLGDDFLESEGPAQTPVPAIEAAEPEPVEAVASSEFRSGTLDDFVSDLEATLGSEPAAAAHAPAVMAQAAAASSMPARPAAPVKSVAPAPPQSIKAASFAGAGVDLANIFGELKEELEEEKSSTDEDPETHYNLGVAFREMGLLDEAIGEFQKVCQAAEHGHAFPQLMQAYTWLAQCFLDKGVPEAAVRWYETALKIPAIDQDTRTALHYELAAAFENAGNKTAALNNFLEVYGNNIDYRDVAERIKALRS